MHIVEYLWKVPVNLCCSKNGKAEIIGTLQSDSEMLLYLDHGSDVDWIKVCE